MNRAPSPDGGSLIEAAAVGVVGAALGAAVGAPLGFGVSLGAVGAANGMITGWRRVYDWGCSSGPIGFVLDSTWALPMTAAALTSQALGVARGAPGYDAFAESAIEPDGVPARVRSPARVCDHGRQCGERRRRHVATAPSQARDRPRGRTRVAGAVVRPVLSRVVRRMDGGRRSCGHRRLAHASAAAIRSPASSSRPRTTSIRSSGGRTAVTTTGHRRARSEASAGASRSCARCAGKSDPPTPEPGAQPQSVCVAFSVTRVTENATQTW